MKGFSSRRPNERNKAYYESATYAIAQRWGDYERRCRIDLTPDTPVSDLPCRGNLQIDHMEGKGYQIRKRKDQRWGTPYYCRTANGGINLTDLRLLCQLHQLWNVIP